MLWDFFFSFLLYVNLILPLNFLATLLSYIVKIISHNFFFFKFRKSSWLGIKICKKIHFILLQSFVAIFHVAKWMQPFAFAVSKDPAYQRIMLYASFPYGLPKFKINSHCSTQGKTALYRWVNAQTLCRGEMIEAYSNRALNYSWVTQQKPDQTISINNLCSINVLHLSFCRICSCMVNSHTDTKPKLTDFFTGNYDCRKTKTCTTLCLETGRLFYCLSGNKLSDYESQSRLCSLLIPQSREQRTVLAFLLWVSSVVPDASEALMMMDYSRP